MSSNGISSSESKFTKREELKEKLTEEDETILSQLEDEIGIWFTERFYETIDKIGSLFTPAQKAIPLILKSENVLISSPTGTGKTLASFIGIINELLKLSKKNQLKNQVYCLYISPLRALANDIKRNLKDPLDEIIEISKKKENKVQKIRHAIRHGDTSSYKRSKMLDVTPHILNTTPETLAIILNAPKFREKLRSVKWVIIDEIHSLADSKRGVHLSLSLERLEVLTSNSFVRIGCSATIEPLDSVAKFLVGYDSKNKLRPYNIIDTRFIRKMKIKLVAPDVDLINASKDKITYRLYKILHKLIQRHENTLIFTNTRHGAESILLNLRKKYSRFYGDHNSGCHHGSLGTKDRIFVEKKLKQGELKVVTTSTSLELGIDMPYIDLVIQIGSPKTICKLIQRIGRSGHEIGGVARGIVLVMNRDDLMECAVMINKAKQNFLDSIQIPKNCLDVLTQHIFGTAINSKWDVDELKKVLKRSYCYHYLPDEDFEKVLDYLAANYVGMEDKKIYAKIWYDKDKNMIGRRGRLSRVIYFTNQGTIPDEFSCDVYTRNNKRFIGNLDEIYLERLRKGDIFVLGGRNYEFRYRRGGKIYVDLTNKNPTIPHWYSEKLPLSFDLGIEILKFKSKFLKKINHTPKLKIIEWLKNDYNCDKNSANNIYNLFYTQLHYLGKKSISTLNKIVIEEYIDYDNRKKYFLFHSNYGLKFNEGLSRILAHLISKRQVKNMLISVGDLGFCFIFKYNITIDFKKYFERIKDKDLFMFLKSALWNSQFLKRYFRINATRFLAILRRYKGRTRSARSQQVSADFLIYYAKRSRLPVLDEAYREIIEDKLQINHLSKIISQINEQIEIEHLKIEDPDPPTPLGVGLLGLGISDWTRSKDRKLMLKDLYDKINEKIRKKQI
ncbi:MAG: ATP-dependent helicase [Candidatus Lokiarchaeota archaeon]|nr:ATP-dependent helicase [Candidatus Lokiarchaeota archaeon]